MIIDKNTASFIVFSEDSLAKALTKISDNKSRIVFCVSASGAVEGVLTDGDVRRWITANPRFDTGVPAIEVANTHFISFAHDTPIEQLEQNLTDRITTIPLVDRHRHLVAIARHGDPKISIGDFTIADDAPTFIIAEIGNNHNGSVELAKRLVDLAAEAGADCAKFQMRSMATLYGNAGDANDASADLGAQYTLDLLSRFQLSNEDMIAVFDHCKARGIMPLCTPWDEESLAVLVEYGMPGFKLASADLTNHEFLAAMARTGRTLICSTGMSSEAEIIDAVRILKDHAAPYVLLHVNSTYPAPFKDINLRYMDRLRTIGDCMVGYSGHERGIAVAAAAVARGARVVEKHFTVDRTMEGNDHRVSLLPDEFRQMVTAIREIEEALGSGDIRRITQGEMMNREILAKSLVASRPIASGETITADMVATRSPGQGLQPYRKAELIGRAATRDLAEGDVFFPSDIESSLYEARPFLFRRPFGVPVRYHDLTRMAEATNLNMLEFHLSYKDMDEDVEAHLRGRTFDLDLVVHSPELFANDHIMDLCSPDPDYRARSIAELQRVIHVTRQLAKHFTRATRPCIIVNAGGFSMDGPIPESARQPLYDLVAQSLAQVDADGVEIIPQTMPPFPWHFGGQRYHNLFMAADELVAFNAAHGYRYCLDVSHSQLACTHTSASFKEFLEAVGPLTAHLHIVDAEGVDGEGLQIGEGTMDFALVADTLNRTAPEASFIPEIWQGHKNDGAGFWEALGKLERWF
jgi:N-acetylneuraminate synthase